MKTLFIAGFLCTSLIGQIATAQTTQLWGATFRGGSRDSGVIYSINEDGSVFTTVDTFYSKKGFSGFSRLSGIPLGSLFEADNGKIYAVNPESGTYAHNNYGIVFSYDPITHVYSIVHDFKLTEGAVPQGSIIQAKDRKLYGVTSWGGTHNYGVIFTINLVDNTYSDVYNFDSDNGYYPKGRLLEASDGKFYGMTQYGGTNNKGVLFSFNPSDSTYKKLVDFDGSNGKYPTGNLIQAKNGILYGMTGNGGANSAAKDYPGGNGVLFSFDPTNNTFLKLRDFDSISGVNPWGSLIQATDGKIYGETSQGGINNNGTIFSYDPVKKAFTKQYDFDNTNGGGPNGTLVQLNKGKLYGVASWGGVNADGVVFSFDPSNKKYKDLFDFNGANGANPFGDLVEVKTNVTTSSLSK